MSDKCCWIHEVLDILPMISYPFELGSLPKNGIYFFYEKDELWGHGGKEPRIVRVGTAKQGNFRSRISEHYLLNPRKMFFGYSNPKPSDRSIFRKNIGRALLNHSHDPYLRVWEIDFTGKANQIAFQSIRDISKEKILENQITERLRLSFSFKFIIIENEDIRLGKGGLEGQFIGTIAKCSTCKPSPHWLGLQSPNQKIRESGLWQSQHLTDNDIESKKMEDIERAVEFTKLWFSKNSLKIM